MTNFKNFSITRLSNGQLCPANVHLYHCPQHFKTLNVSLQPQTHYVHLFRVDAGMIEYAFGSLQGGFKTFICRFGRHSAYSVLV